MFLALGWKASNPRGNIESGSIEDTWYKLHVSSTKLHSIIQNILLAEIRRRCHLGYLALSNLWLLHCAGYINITSCF